MAGLSQQFFGTPAAPAVAASVGASAATHDRPERSCWPSPPKLPADSPPKLQPTCRLVRGAGDPGAGNLLSSSTTRLARGAGDPGAGSGSNLGGALRTACSPRLGLQESLDPEAVAKVLATTLGPWLQEGISQSIAEAMENHAAAGSATTGQLAPAAQPRTRAAGETTEELAAPPAPTLAEIEQCVEAAVRATILAEKAADKERSDKEAAAGQAVTAAAGPGAEDPSKASPRPVGKSALRGKSKSVLPALSGSEEHMVHDTRSVKMISQGEIVQDTVSVDMSDPGNRNYDYLPTLLAHRNPERKATLASEFSMTTVVRTHEEANKKALVINFRRLLAMKDGFYIIHEVIKATTIALLALLAVKNEIGLYYNCIFLCFGISMFAHHQAKFMLTDTSDFKKLIAQLGNDGQTVLSRAPFPGGLQNPNRQLQAVSFSRKWWSGTFPFVILFCFVLFLGGCWAFVGCWWANKQEGDDLFRHWIYVRTGINQSDDMDIENQMEHYITLLLVGTFMLFCHLCFEVVYWRETGWIMPPNKDGQVWDVLEHGTPPGFLMRLFGLPCVWFSTCSASEDLRTWVTLASAVPEPKERTNFLGRVDKVFHRIFSEELALYAVEDMGCASQLRNCLLHAKLYDKHSCNFLYRMHRGEFNLEDRHTMKVRGLSKQHAHGGVEEFYPVKIMQREEPTELGVELLFYDSRTKEVWVPSLPGQTGLPGQTEGALPENLPRNRDFLIEMLGEGTGAGTGTRMTAAASKAQLPH